MGPTVMSIMATATPSKRGPAPQEDVGSSLGLPGGNWGKAGFLAWDVAEQEMGEMVGSASWQASGPGFGMAQP